MNNPPSPSPPSLLPPEPAEFIILERDIDDVAPEYRALLVQFATDRQSYKLIEQAGSAAEPQRKQYDEFIRDLFRDIGFNRIHLPDSVVEECRGRTESTLSATRLLELGVDPEIIKQATEPGKYYRFVKVRPRTHKEQAAYDLRQSVRQPDVDTSGRRMDGYGSLD